MKFCQNHTCSGYCLRYMYQAGKRKGLCRECRGGAGVEITPGKGDTPGFILRCQPSIVADKRGFKKLEMSRNHKRIVQTALAMLQSWRGNCDFQVLLYDCDPLAPDPTEIAKVTDYVVAYQCKGNKRLADEKKEIRNLIFRMRDDTGTKHDVIKLSRHLLNCAASNRTISKQECMVLLDGLELVLCSDSIETVSITGQQRLENNARTTFLKKYQNRPSSCSHMSLDEYFHFVKRNYRGKKIIPHYVGGRSQPVYPATEGFARATFIIHKPWIGKQKPYCENADLVKQFYVYLRSNECPLSVKIPYERARYRALEKLIGREAVGKEMETTSTNDIDSDIIDVLQIAATFNAPCYNDSLSQYNLDRGYNYDWSSRRIQVSSRQKSSFQYFCR